MTNSRPFLPCVAALERVGVSPHFGPLHLSMCTIEARRSTFKEWTQEFPVEKLIDAGFYSIQKEDRVQCFSCGGGLCNWKPEDDPLNEHAKHYPDCEFLLLKNKKQSGGKMKKKDFKCKICLKNEVEMLFLPCSHLVSCATCAVCLSRCPICRAGIRGTTRFYLS